MERQNKIGEPHVKTRNLPNRTVILVVRLKKILVTLNIKKNRPIYTQNFRELQLKWQKRNLYPSPTPAYRKNT